MRKSANMSRVGRTVVHLECLSLFPQHPTLAKAHAGPVIAGEVGESRRAIVFHGDVMHTASRLEGATRDLERQFLVSGDALEHLEGLEGYAVEDLGLQRLRGRDAAVPVYAVTAQPKN